MVEDVDEDELFRPERPRHGATDQPDGPGPEDHHALARLDVDHAHRVGGHGERFREYPFLQAHGRGEPVAKVGRDLVVLGQAAGGVGRTGGELHRRAQVVDTLFASGARAAWPARLDGHVVPRLDVCDCLPDGVDGAGRFVAHDQWERLGDIFTVDASVVPEMDLGRG